jgi:hypothetical protein
MSLPARNSVRDASTRSSGSEHDELNDDLKSTHIPDLEKTDGITAVGLNLAYEKGPTAGKNPAGGVDRPWKYKGPALACIIFLTRKSGPIRTHFPPDLDNLIAELLSSEFFHCHIARNSRQQLCPIVPLSAEEHHP